MKKIQLTLVFMLLLQANVFAQQVRLKAGESIVSEGMQAHAKGKHDNAVYVVMDVSYNEIKICKFDSKELKLLSEKQIKIPKINGAHALLVTHQLFAGRIVIFANTLVKKQYDMYAFFVNEDGTLDESPEKIFSADTDRFERRGFRAKLSADKSNLLMLEHYYDKESEQYLIEAKVFGEDMEITNEMRKTIDIGKKGLLTQLKTFTIDNNGEIYLLFSNSNSNGYILSYEATIHTADQKSLKYDLSLQKLSGEGQDKFIASAIFEVSSEGDLWIVGYYYGMNKDEKWDNSRIVGTYAIRIDRALDDVASASVLPFDEPTIRELVRDRGRQTGKGVSADYRPLRILFNENGNAYILGEYFSTMPGNMGNTLGEFGPAVITYVDKKGDLKWTQTIFKKQSGIAYSPLPQSTVRGSYYSFAALTKGGKLYIVLNDKQGEDLTIKLSDRKEDVKPNTDLSPVVFEIDEDGKLLNTKRVADKAYLQIGKSNAISDSEVLIFSEKGGKMTPCMLVVE